MSSRQFPTVKFRPRRIGHANLFVGNLERSMAFYGRVCGIEEVRREPGIEAGFLSNGNTHHDIGLMQSGEGSRIGRDGYVQPSSQRGFKPGLNHFGWEVDNEASLVAAWRRASEADLPLHQTTDHQISHSVYIFDPDGNLHEFYADVVDDWRAIFNPSREDLVSGKWDPAADAPDPKPHYEASPELRRMNAAPLHPLRLTSVSVVARDLARMRAFLTDVAGLEPLSEDGRSFFFAGALGRPDLELLPAREGQRPGLCQIAFELPAGEDLDASAAQLDALGILIEERVDRPEKAAIVLKDPDGLRVEFIRPSNALAVPAEVAQTVRVG